jgi:16S rRNA (cytosine967-C5)-methyltransferase
VEEASNTLKPSEDVVAITIEALSLVELEGMSFRAAVDRAANQLQVKEAPLVREARRLAFETLNRKNLLDLVVKEALAPAELDNFNLGVQAFLRIFAYETKISSNLMEPTSLAELGRRVLGWRELTPVERALGRIVSANMKDVLGDFHDDESVALKTFNPLWFVRYTIRTFGRPKALQLLSTSRPSGRTFVRLNTFRIGETKTLEELKSKDIVLEPIEGLPSIYGVHKAEVGLRMWIAKGLLRMQDLPSTLAVVASKPKAGKRVLFVDASPAASATYAAQLMGDRGDVLVFDSVEERLSRVLADASSAGVSIVRTELIENPLTVPNLQADTVMLHAPNSRTGVFWREPSIRWRSQSNIVEHFAETQGELLDAWSKAVRPGGDLVYWTRSVAVEEDELAVEQFLKRHPEFIISDTLPKIGVPSLRGQYQSQRLFPHIHLCDGAFVAMMTKQEPF